jgi:putative endonuclease
MKNVVYAIQSLVSGRIYIGQTEDIERRLKEHNSGKVGSTSDGKPWTLLKTELFASRSEARWAERQLKMSRGRREKWLSLDNT